ncbi:aromatic ring-hydroxylating oxygenase subunit alpha [Pacificispira sp.]|uniref:aromatic ring-hydroxylating oxygenase subunit alpha n=1 Tax=Pacificispira sp. TaxID=2888761 RepID=UPI003B529F63
MTSAATNVQVPSDWDRGGLPAWTYHNEELTEIEKEVLFRRHWQLACHVSNVPNPGDYLCFDMVGERAVIMHGDDGQIRAFHNLCRHRGSRVLPNEQGTCKRVITCPFHGWSYGTDGTLRNPAVPDSLPQLDKVKHGLKPIELEIWMGFVFIRFKEGEQPPISELMKRHEAEVAPYLPETMVPAYDSIWSQEMDVNWKAVRDVDNEGYHVPMAHPGLQDLYGKHYVDEPMIDGTNRSVGPFTETDGRLWSVKNYKKILPDRPNLPPESKRAWLYLGIFPNTVIGFYPDSMIFYHEYPVAAGKTIQRGTTYRYADEDRQLRVARYLSERIDRITVEEDTQLIKWSCEAMQSSAFDGIILSDREYGVRCYHDALRERIPVMNEEQAPAFNQVAAVNAAYGDRKAAAVAE